MASWSAIPALSGWNYNGVEGALEVNPRLKGSRFESFWSTGSGWGTFAQVEGARNTLVLKVSEGALNVRSLGLAWDGVKKVTLDGKTIPFRADQGRIAFEGGVKVTAGSALHLFS
jgi:hypothetical protein